MATEHLATWGAADQFAPEEVALRPRNVHFQWDTVPLHWIPGDPYGAHVVTSLNLLLPVAERWFTKLLSDALEYVRDEHLREEIHGFIGQESVHAKTHDRVLVEYLQGHGIDPATLYPPAGMGSRPVRPADLQGRAA